MLLYNGLICKSFKLDPCSVLTMDYTVYPRLFTNATSHAWLYSQPQSITALWPVLTQSLPLPLWVG